MLRLRLPRPNRLGWATWVALALLVVGIPFTWNVAAPPWAEAELARRLGHPVSVGDVSLSTDGLVLEDVRIQGSAPFEGEPLARIDRMKVRLGITAPRVRGVEIAGADIVVLAARGADNLRGRRGSAPQTVATAGTARKLPPVVVTNARVQALWQLPNGRRVGLRMRDVSFERTGVTPTRASVGALVLELAHRATVSFPEVKLEEQGNTGSVVVRAANGEVRLPGAPPVLDGLHLETAWDGRLEARLTREPRASDPIPWELEAVAELGGEGASARVRATAVPLRGLAPLFDGLATDVDRAVADLTGDVRLPDAGEEAPFTVVGAVRHLDLHHPGVDRTPWRDLPVAFELRGTVDPDRGRVALANSKVELLGLPLGVGGWVEPGRHPRGSLVVGIVEPGVPCVGLLAAQPAPVQRALWGMSLGGRLSGSAHVTFDASAWDELALDLKIGQVCKVASEPEALSALLPSLIKGKPTPRARELGLPLGPYHADYVALPKIPKHLQSAFLTAEDGQFWTHRGFHVDGIRRALAHDLEVGAFARGASTITQQLAKNLFLTHDRTIARKLSETVLTWRLDALLPKARVLELYLNILELGPGIRGVAQASGAYFGKPAVMLAPIESAHLASLAPNPRGFARRFREGRVDESWLIHLYDLLGTMKRTGRLTPSELQAARASKLQLRSILERS